MQRSEPLDRVLARLDGVVAQNGHHMALCPAHADRNPSLKIDVNRNGDVLLHCFAGCMTQDVLAALDLTFRDLSPEQPQPPPPAPRRIVKTTDYPIRDRNGNLIATHRRVDYDDDGKNVTWPPGTRPKELPLYGIHTRRDDHERVIVVEGEKARDALDAVTPHDCLVVGTVCGAGATPNLDVLSDLAGLHVILWPDNDDAGRKHMERIAARLDRDAQWISWPDAPPKGDAADWVATGGADPFAPESGLLFLSSGDINITVNPEERYLNTNNSTVTIRPAPELWKEADRVIEWLAEPWVRVGGLTMIAGKPKIAGKTTLVFHLVRAVLDGGEFLGRAVRKGPVLIFSEQGGSSLHEAMDAAGIANSPDLHVATYRDLGNADWPTAVAAGFAYAQRVGAVLFVIDTLTACASIINENDAGEAREAMKPVAIGADAAGIASIVTFHDKKGEAEVGESQRGSSAYAGAVDIVLRLLRPGGNFEPTIRKIEALSRFAATPDELFIQLVGGEYLSLGSENDVLGDSLRHALASILPPEAGAAMPVVDRKLNGTVVEPGILPALAQAGIRIGRERLDQVLFLGYRAGAFGRSGEARRNSPHRYWLLDSGSPFLSSGFAEIGGAPEERNQYLSSDGYGASEERNGGETWTPDQQSAFWREP